MKQVLARLVDRMRNRRDEGEGGFSLIELIVVVAILGVLVAIAIQVFGNIQSTAQVNATKAVAANAATQATAQLANGETPTLLKTGDENIKVSWNTAEPTAINEVCVKAVYGEDVAVATSGPGC